MWYLPVCLCFESTKVPLLEIHVMRHLWWEVEPRPFLRDLPSWVHQGLGALWEWGPYKSGGSASVFPCFLPLPLYDMVTGSDAGPWSLESQARTFLIIRSYHSVHGDYVQGKLQQHKHTTADHQICGQSVTRPQTDENSLCYCTLRRPEQQKDIHDPIKGNTA